MNDLQFLTAMRMRTCRRPSNFHLVAILDELIEQTRQIGTLERDIIERLGQICLLYTKLDIDDLVHMELANYWPKFEKQGRAPFLKDRIRLQRLHRAGFILGRSGRRHGE